MTNTSTPAATDADLLAAIDRGIAAGQFVVVDDAFLATLAADIDRCAVCSGPYAEVDTAEGLCCAECAGLED